MRTRFWARELEVQDVLVQLDKDLADLFAHLDKEVGRGNYVVALSADHGGMPIPEDMQSTGADSGVLHVPDVQDRIEKALESFGYPKARHCPNYRQRRIFCQRRLRKLSADPNSLKAVLATIRTVPGVAAVYRAEELRDRPATQSPTLRAFANSYSRPQRRSLHPPKPYWLVDGTPAGKTRSYGTSHVSP